ncbi:hypothetical protein M2302_004277 [Micromonospora sp. A200]|nr:hypothetical protein [Micromonospora sp. A200]
MLDDRRRVIGLHLGVHVRVDLVVDPEVSGVGHQQCLVH